MNEVDEEKKNLQRRQFTRSVSHVTFGIFIN